MSRRSRKLRRVARRMVDAGAAKAARVVTMQTEGLAAVQNSVPHTKLVSGRMVELFCADLSPLDGAELA